jgi:plastocyanin
MHLSRILAPAACALALSGALPATAAEPVVLTLKDHQFQPAEIEVPAGEKFKLLVKNEDSTPEEFESKALKVEKIVAGHGKITLNLGPLPAGSYEFVGEFHEAAAKGRIVAK